MTRARHLKQLPVTPFGNPAAYTASAGLTSYLGYSRNTAPSWTAPGADYALDFTTQPVRAHGGSYVPTLGGFARLRSLVGGTSTNSPLGKYAENADGSLRTTAQYELRATTRGTYCEGALENIVNMSNVFTDAVWVATGMTAVKNQTSRLVANGTPVANSATLLTATAANATLLQTLTGQPSLVRGFYLDIKRISGTGTIEITQDGATWVPVSGVGNRNNGFFRYTTGLAGAASTGAVVGIRLGTSGDQVAIFEAQCDGGPYESSIIPRTTLALQSQQVSGNDRTTIAQTLGQGSLLSWMARRKLWAIYVEWSQRRDGGLFVSDGGFQLQSTAAGGVTYGDLNLGLPVFATSTAYAEINRAVVCRNGAVSSGCLNGAPIQFGTTADFQTTISHFDFGTNGAASQRIDGVMRCAHFLPYNPSEAVMRDWTANGLPQRG